jgi:hypothetical protein
MTCNLLGLSMLGLTCAQSLGITLIAIATVITLALTAYEAR